MSIPNYALGQGLRPYLLRHLRDIIGEGNLPQTKIEHVGLLNMLQVQNKPQVLRLNNAAGHRESVQVKYLQRYTEDFTFTNEGDVCNNSLFDPYKEATATLTSFRAISMHLEDEIVARYEDDASKYISEGMPATQLMNEMIERIMTAANAIMSGIRTDLLTTLVNTGIGVNRATGNNAAKTVNFPLNATTMPLNSGINEIMTDFQINLLSGTPQIIGDPAGLFNKFMNQQYAKSYNQAGINTAMEAAGVKFFNDAKVGSLLGNNEVLVIEPNSIELVEYLQYTGFKAGTFPGNTIFGTIKLPFQIGTEVQMVELDFALSYEPCSRQYIDNYYGTTVTYQKGWNIVLSKKCGLFQIPADAYRGSDPNSGVNGCLRYNITNI